MDIKKFEVILKKINTLKQNIDLSGEDISQLELELLKNYVKRLYESIAVDTEEWEEKVEKVKKKKKKKVKTKLQPTKELENDLQEEMVEEDQVEEVVEKELETQPEIKAAEKMNEPVEKEESVSYEPELLALFEGSSASELSEKLSSAPIKDMKKAMGINDQIFTINELFGGDKALFQSTLEKLNAFENFDQAKDYLLAEIALPFNWSKADNHKKVKRFVKLVQRRYA